MSFRQEALQSLFGPPVTPLTDVQSAASSIGVDPTLIKRNPNPDTPWLVTDHTGIYVPNNLDGDPNQLRYMLSYENAHRINNAEGTTQAMQQGIDRTPLAQSGNTFYPYGQRSIIAQDMRTGLDNYLLHGGDPKPIFKIGTDPTTYQGYPSTHPLSPIADEDHIQHPDIVKQYQDLQNYYNEIYKNNSYSTPNARVSPSPDLTYLHEAQKMGFDPNKYSLRYGDMRGVSQAQANGDMITIDPNAMKPVPPAYRNFIYGHEMYHATPHDTRFNENTANLNGIVNYLNKGENPSSLRDSFNNNQSTTPTPGHPNPASETMSMINQLNSQEAARANALSLLNMINKHIG